MDSPGDPWATGTFSSVKSCLQTFLIIILVWTVLVCHRDLFQRTVMVTNIIIVLVWTVLVGHRDLIQRKVLPTNIIEL